jgi:hypothetical protein
MHGNSMNVSVKNNLKLLRKRDKFKYVPRGYNSNKKTEYNLPKATLKQLRDIRKKMQQERKVWWVKGIALTIIIFFVLTYCLLKR